MQRTEDGARERSFEIGVFTFAEMDPDGAGGAEEARRRLDELVAAMELADRVGLDVFGVGEHHRPDFAVSAPTMALAAGAARTESIRLTSAVTVLSSEDPVRVFQQFATLDLLSGGRAEIMAGRGSFTESFPLFGYDLANYDTLFDEKLELLLRLRERERITWSGRHRAALDDVGVFPRPLQRRLPVWIAVGGTPRSAARAGRLGLPLAVAILGGDPARFRPLVDLYRDAAERAGHDPATLPISINTQGHIADDGDDAADALFRPYAAMMNRVGRERGWPPITRQQFDGSRSLNGPLAVGSPQEIIDKILHQHEIFGHQRYLMQLIMTLPHEEVLRSIELLGTEVAPVVRKEIASAG
jgi:probable LLM family oxidoreductase